MTTIWTPYEIPDIAGWILEDGRFIETPPLEISGHHRKVRIKGTTTSVFLQDCKKLIYTNIARRLDYGAPWMPVVPRDLELFQNRDRAAEILPRAGRTQPELVLLRDKLTYPYPSVSLSYWYLAESLPLSVELRITLKAVPARFRIVTQAFVPSTNPSDPYSFSRIDLDQQLPMSKQEHYSWRRSLPRESVYPNDLAAAEGLLNLLDQVDSLSTITIPGPTSTVYDVTEIRHTQPSILLDPVASNVTSEFRQQLTDLLTLQPDAKEAVAAFDEFRHKLRLLGMVVDPISPTGLIAALHGKDLTATVQGVQGGTRFPAGHDHITHLHLPTGVLSCECPMYVTSQTITGEKFQVARFEAELRGELDAFLGYHAQMLDETGRQRLLQLIDSVYESKDQKETS